MMMTGYKQFKNLDGVYFIRSAETLEVENINS